MDETEIERQFEEMIDEDRLDGDQQAAMAEKRLEISNRVGFDYATTGNPLPIVDEIVRQTPPAAFVKTHPFGKFQYIPIAVLDPLAQALDPTTHSELLREGTVANGFYCVVRLYFNGRTYDGIGASEFQTSKGAAPTDFTKLNTGAITMGVPKARSEALKNAYAQIGDLFGRGLRRKENITMMAMENSKLLRAKKVEEKRKAVGL